MPLPKATSLRQLLHTREISCQGYLRDDEDWDIEGHLIDKKTYSFPNIDRLTVLAGEPVHEMHVRLTIDNNLLIKVVETVTDHGPFKICGNITPNFKMLEGLQIKVGFNKEVLKRVGGVNGCTHHIDLLKSVVTTAIQTIFPYIARKNGASNHPNIKQLDQCHAYATDGPLVKERWPKYYKEKHIK